MRKLIKETDVILNRAKDYYESDKERLKEQAKDKYRNLSEEEKNKREYWKNRYHSMSEEKRQITSRLKSLNVINKTVLIMYMVIYAN